MLNWNKFKCSFSHDLSFWMIERLLALCLSYTNLVDAPLDVCLQDTSIYSMLSCRGPCKKVNNYLEGVAKMKKSQVEKEVVTPLCMSNV